MTSVREQESAIGADVVVVKLGPNIVFRNYLVDRPAHTKTLRAVEAVLEVSITLPHPVGQVWPIFKNFNSWMNRFGYVWQGLPAENENGFVYLGNTGASNDLQYGLEGSKNQYVVRKVVKEQLIYLDSLPYRLIDKDAVFTGHNLISMHEKNGHTNIAVFMEHTWYSETMRIEELRGEARRAMFVDAMAFWRDYFVPDLMSLVEAALSKR